MSEHGSEESSSYEDGAGVAEGRVDGLDESRVEMNDVKTVDEVPDCGGGSSRDCTTSELLDGGADLAGSSPENLEASGTTGIDRLLMRHRNEIMFELRRLQLGDRPVTGQDDRRQAVEALVNRFAGTADPEPSTSPAFAGPTPRQHRPEQILVEVNALVERRPVSSILQSPAFRSSLENTVRGAIGMLRANNGGQTSYSRRPQNVAVQLNDPTNQESGLSSRRSSIVASEQNSGSGGLETNVGPIRSTTGLTGSSIADIPVVGGPERAQAWVQQHVPPPALAIDNLRQQLVTPMEALEQLHHENLIADISDLIQRQLVTSALEGQIRDTLEQQLRRHVEQNGIDGQRVLRQIRQLPRTGIRRNDFFDLGITGGAPAAEALDNVSVISATAAVTLPHSYAQSTTVMGREIHGLRSQIQELTRMVQLSFDLQLDIQRAIRQEVAAVVSQAVGQAVGGASQGSTQTSARPVHVASSSPPQPPPAASEGQCLICLDKPVDTVLYQCGHMCLCHSCGMRLRHQGAHCPVCRAPIRDIIRAYLSS